MKWVKAGFFYAVYFHLKIMERKFPKATFQVDTADLLSVVCFPEIETICQLCRVNIDTATAWRNGSKPVPYTAYALLKLHVRRELPECFGRFSGWRLFSSGRLVPPGGHVDIDGISLNDMK